MKIVKLDRRHHLYHKGYRYAFCTNYIDIDLSSFEIEWTVEELEGQSDNIFCGKPKDGSKPYYIGVKNESTITMTLLKL